MNTFMIILLTFIIVCLLLIWAINIYNQYQNYIIRINEAEANIDATLRKRFDLLNKSISIIKANTKEKGGILDMIADLREQKLINFELDRQLYEAINEFQHYKETYSDLKQHEAFVKIDLGLTESESEMIAFRKYYNDIITDYNKIVRTFPSNVIAKLKSYKAKPYFDGKEMNQSEPDPMKL